MNPSLTELILGHEPAVRMGFFFGMLTIPFVGKVAGYAINHRRWNSSK